MGYINQQIENDPDLCHVEEADAGSSSVSCFNQEKFQDILREVNNETLYIGNVSVVLKHQKCTT